ncbi:glycosyltransferase family 2 protein [Tritonibacter scottomollicae]|uniref:Teichuronic acid biosynthesis glycosyltransferase TuaG n=1 Tax=Tritonibacter scottomollicae TaxID=483013 RepID=A0A2T1A5V9_TRISK|nr:glycosyltransferase family 2 protein [Tritonibacter scottomollicae]PRZ43857.1 teichuronic acid biosynthesis glycosyltransferase TuaG [Tritonibacter scottomollicae]
MSGASRTRVLLCFCIRFSMPAPKTSILMPIYNAQATLTRSVASVQGQSCTDWELLMIDDGSADGSSALAAQLAKGDPRLRLLSPGGNHGAAVARNFGLQHARGRFIAFLDSDDCWHADKLTRQVAFMEQTGAALSFTGYERRTAQGALITYVNAPPQLTYADMLGPNLMGCLTVMYDSQQLGLQPMPDLPLQHDYALWLRLIRLGGPARGLDETLASFRVSSGSLSSDKRKAVRDIWKVWRTEEGLTLSASLHAFVRYAGYSLRHRLVQRPARNSSAHNTTDSS